MAAKMIDSGVSFPECVLFMGNPGVGKSTLLNGLFGDAVFPSGYATNGYRVTHQGTSRKLAGVHYWDTPGLDSMEEREQAAAEIAEALRQNGEYRIIFVVTVESGRVRPGDVATIRLVLDTIDQIVPYGIVINKVSPALARLADENEDDLKALFTSLMPDDKRVTPFVFLFPYDLDLADADNCVPAIPDLFWKFLRYLPSVLITSEGVNDLAIETFEELRDLYAYRVKLLARHAEAMQVAVETGAAAAVRENTRWGWSSRILSVLPFSSFFTSSPVPTPAPPAIPAGEDNNTSCADTGGCTYSTKA